MQIEAYFMHLSFAMTLNNEISLLYFILFPLITRLISIFYQCTHFFEISCYFVELYYFINILTKSLNAPSVDCDASSQIIE